MTAPAPDEFAARLWAIHDAEKNAKRDRPHTGRAPSAGEPTGEVVHISDPNAYALSALQRTHDELATCHEGGRNHALNTAAFTLGRLVGAHLLTEQAVTDTLTAACQTNGLLNEDGRYACEATIRSGLAGGARDPLRWEHAASASAPAVAPFIPRIVPTTAPATSSEEREPNPLRALDLARLAEPCPPPDWLVEDRMTRQSLTLLGSKPGVGKSWTALDLALAITTGREWLGHKTRLGRVLYIDVENGEPLATRRLQQLGADPSLIEGRLHYVTESVIFPGGEDSRRLRDTLETFRPDLVIVDTLASAAPSAEKDTESMSLFLYDVWHRSRQHGAAVLILAHLRKSQQGVSKDDPLDSFRGAGHLVGAASRAWLLEPKGGERFSFRDVKAREFTAHPSVIVRLHDEPADGAIIDKRTVVLCDGEVDEDDVEVGLAGFQKRCLRFIDGTALGRATSAELLHLGMDVAPATARNYLTRLVHDGVLSRADRGVYVRAQSVPDDLNNPAPAFNPDEAR